MKRLSLILAIIVAFLSACSDNDDNPVGSGGLSDKAPLFSVHVVDTTGQPVEGLNVGSINLGDHLYWSPPLQSASMIGTTIEFSLPESNSIVTLEVQDYFRDRVRLLLDREVLTAGTHSVTWDNMDDQSVRIRSGYYFYYLLVTDSSGTKLLDDKKAIVLDYGSNPWLSLIGHTDNLGIFSTDNILFFPCLLTNPPTITETDAYGNLIGEIEDFYTDTISITLSDPSDSTKFMYFKRGLVPDSNSFELIWNPNEAI